MKKLMIALTAVAAAALVAKADTDLGGSNFNKMTTGAFDVNVQESSKAYGEASYWALPEGATSESQVVEASADDKYLKIEETAVLERKINPDGTVDIPENGSVVISSKVQFTATEEEKVEPDGGAKLAIWLQKLEGAETATLMVTSGKIVDEEFKAVATPIEGVTVNENEWYDLVVTSTADETGALAFTIKIGETVIPGTFNSLVPYGETGYATIASVGFKGTGAVDDIAFTAVEGEVAVPVTLAATVNGAEPEEGVVAIMMGDDEVAEANVGETVKIVVAAEADATVAAEGLTFNFDEENMAWIAQYELTEADGTAGAKTFAITVETAPGPEPEPIQPTIKPEGAVVEGLPEGGFVIGTEYDTAAFTVTPAEHKTATVVVKVNGEVVEGKFTLEEGDTVEIEVTEADITHKLTIPTVEGATAAVTDAEGVEVADITAIVEGTVVTVTWTAQDGYKLTDGSLIEEVTMNADQEALAPTFTAITYATVTVDADAGVKSVTLTVNGEKIDPETYKADVDDAVVVAVAYELNDKKVLADGCTVPETVTLTENATITIRTDDEQDPESTRPTDIEGGSSEQKAAYDAWAKENGVTGTDAANVDAFILNAKPGDDLEAKLGAEISADMVAALAAGETADFTALKEKYPNATFEFVEYTEIETSAKLYKLTAKFVPANATK